MNKAAKTFEDFIVRQQAQRWLFALFCFVFLSAFNLSAQSADEAEITIQISALSLADNIEGLMIQTGEAVEELDIYTSTRSRMLTYRGPSELIFFRETKDAEGEIVRNPVGSVRINQNHSRYLLFFMSNPGSAEAYNIIAFADDLETFPAGTLRFLNLTAHTVGVSIDDERHIIQRRNFTDVRGNFEHGNYYRAVFISAPEDTDPFISYSGRIFFNQRMRMIYLIFPVENRREGSISFRAIRHAVSQ